MESNMYHGVRAEPKFLRDPTSLESISSGISRISSYVASNLPKRKSSMMGSPFDPQQYYQQQQQMPPPPLLPPPPPPMMEEIDDNDMEDMDSVTFASFELLEYRDKTISCLLLGYHDGFQLWDITNPDNVHEIYSIRDKNTFGTVSLIHILKGQHEPMLAIISDVVDDNEEPHSRSSSVNSFTSSHLVIYSMESQSIVKEITDLNDEDDDNTQVTCIKSNHKVIVLGCVSRHHSSIRILSTHDFTPFSTPLTDVYHDPNGNGPTFTLGTRFIAYATNAAVLNSDPVMTSLTNKSISYSVLQGDKDVKGAAKDIAKEVVSGMKTLGEFGFNTLQSYFGNSQSGQQPSSQQQQQQQDIYGSSPSSRRMSNHSNHTNSPKENIYTNTANSGTANASKKMVPSGMIMIRDILKLPKSPTRNLSLSIIAHFRPHTHPVSCLTFNKAGTLLMSASKQGHTFHIFSIFTNTSHGNASHLYSLSRGITDAQVVDCQFSVDSTWCAITTARGTTHVYAINPYGGKPEISGHVHGKVNNPVHYPFALTSSGKTFNAAHSSKVKATHLSSVVRIKQRRKMPGNNNNLSASQDDLAKYAGGHHPIPSQNTNGYVHGYYGPTPPHYMSSMPAMHRNSTGSNTNSNSGGGGGGGNKELRAKVTTMFVTASKSPYLANNSMFKNSMSLNASDTNTLGSFKQQASNMLSSFGTSMGQLPYLPSNSGGNGGNGSGSGGSNSNHAASPHASQHQHSKKWDKSGSDTLMFGFDEEYDDSTKMINDEIGYQDMYSFHPDGILTLHRCWVAKTVVKKRESGRMIEKLDLSLKEEDVAEWRVARSADWDQVRITLDPEKQQQQQQQQQQSTNEGEKKKKQKPSSPAKYTFAVDTRKKKLWLSNAEITTYTADEPALWTRHQFSFQTYKQDIKDLQTVLNTGAVPATDTLIMLKGMPEPVSSRIDRVRKTTTHIANDNVEETMEDALAELEDNISKAMQTSFSPSNNSMGNSPATNLKWLSSSANAAMTGSPSPSANKSFLDRNSSVSFEDAYLINMGSGPSPEPSMPSLSSQQQQQGDSVLQHSSLIQFDDDDDDSNVGLNESKDGVDALRLEDNDSNNNSSEEEEEDLRVPATRRQVSKERPRQPQPQQSDVYSPDGDNEVEYPYESVYENLHQRSSKDESDDDHQVPW